jgi:hypothetical protein
MLSARGYEREKKPPFEDQGKQGCADSALRYRLLRGRVVCRKGRAEARPYIWRVAPASAWTRFLTLLWIG